jgi:hypothetical protein
MEACPWKGEGLEDLVEDLNNPLQWAPRVDWSDFTPEVYRRYVIEQTFPLVVTGVMEAWTESERDTFALGWLKEVSLFL